jgi:CO/xanthine dehydrogenase Mo-binding subunit
VRVKGTVMGGGFGGKEDIAGQLHAALAAQVTGRPVKVLYTREESLRFHPKRHATIIRMQAPAPNATVCSPRSRPNSTATAAPTPAWAKR